MLAVSSAIVRCEECLMLFMPSVSKIVCDPSNWAMRQGARATTSGRPYKNGLLFHELALIEVVVQAAQLEQIVMSPTFDDAAFLHDADLIGVLDGTQAMGDDDRGATMQQALQRFLNQTFGEGIDTGGGFIQNQDARISQRCPRDGNQLPLPQIGRAHV